MMILIKPHRGLKKAYEDYIQEWDANDEKVIPYSASQREMTFESLLESWSEEPTELAYTRNFVPSQLYFLVEEDRILGALHLRHELNAHLLTIGGHIGYGVRPSERKKGYVIQMMKQILPVVKSLNIKQLLLTCNSDNIASEMTIKKCGGILENELEVFGKSIKRFWIDVI